MQLYQLLDKALELGISYNQAYTLTGGEIVQLWLLKKVRERGKQ